MNRTTVTGAAIAANGFEKIRTINCATSQFNESEIIEAACQEQAAQSSTEFVLHIQNAWFTQILHFIRLPSGIFSKTSAWQADGDHSGMGCEEPTVVVGSFDFDCGEITLA